MQSIRCGIGQGSPICPGLDQEEFSNAILRERRWELCFEGHRYFDLKRMEKLQSAMAGRGITVEDKRLIYPIPLRELD